MQPRCAKSGPKRITLEKIRRTLETMRHEVTIDPSVAGPARRAVERMLAI